MYIITSAIDTSILYESFFSTNSVFLFFFFLLEKNKVRITHHYWLAITMGDLFKEALKTLCGVNQWSYAVFWKIGFQNPKLLIWEECYYGSSPSVVQNSSVGKEGISMQKQEGYKNGEQVDDRVQLLVDRMMMSNHINVVGEGLVGRAVFTGDHQWIVSGYYNEIAHPAEVHCEVQLQFSAGMQTIAVIPVIPYGVVQLGSPLIMMENVGFVHDVRSFILQLGCIPNALVSDNYYTKDAASMLELLVSDLTTTPIDLHGIPISMSPSDRAIGSFHPQRNSAETHRIVNQSSDCLLTQFQDNLQVSDSTFMMPNLSQDSCKAKGRHDAASISTTMLNSIVHPNGANKISQGVLMPMKSDSVINQPILYYPGSGISCPQSSDSCWHPKLSKQLLASHEGSIEEKFCTSTSVFNPNEGHSALNKSNLLSEKSGLDIGVKGEYGCSFQTSACGNMLVQDTCSTIKDVVGLSRLDKSSISSSLTGVLTHGNCIKDSGITAEYIQGKLQDNDGCEFLETPLRKQEILQSGGFIRDNFCSGNQVPPSKNSVPEDMFVQSTAGDDLFDALGMGLKHKLLNGNSSYISRSVNSQILGSGYSDYGGISESGSFSLSDSDHLLDAVISGISSNTRQILDDDASCKSAVSKISSPCRNPLFSGMFNMSDRVQGQLLGITRPVVRSVEPTGTLVSSVGKNDDGSYTDGSQIGSWIEQGPSTSVSTANSKKSDGGKSNRKRFKPGENPRPRPKDRQMIQDRVKELREIVPSGAKCSIDALLERTIKHMLFLQSVTQHADKLEQTVGSKIANKEGGMLLKDEFQGSATWAFQLGSQSLVCPIVVEDLNPPRQLLIEMFCEQGGFFLEIADIIRGLGLTILKGVMEARDDKIWARFAVEANRDVTRMEVFISLVHLLEQTLKCSTTIDKGTNDENYHSSFCFHAC